MNIDDQYIQISYCPYRLRRDIQICEIIKNRLNKKIGWCSDFVRFTFSIAQYNVIEAESMNYSLHPNNYMRYIEYMLLHQK